MSIINLKFGDVVMDFDQASLCVVVGPANRFSNMVQVYSAQRNSLVEVDVDNLSLRPDKIAFAPALVENDLMLSKVKGVYKYQVTWEHLCVSEEEARTMAEYNNSYFIRWPVNLTSWIIVDKEDKNV